MIGIFSTMLLGGYSSLIVAQEFHGRGTTPHGLNRNRNDLRAKRRPMKLDKLHSSENLNGSDYHLVRDRVRVKHGSMLLMISLLRQNRPIGVPTGWRSQYRPDHD